MSKKQVLLLSSVVALPAIGLLVALVFGALADGGKMFSGIMTVIVAVTGLLVLCLGLSPFAIMAFYPAEGFGAFSPPPADAPGAPPEQRPGTDEDDEFEEDGFESDEYEDDGGGFDDGGGEELYEDDDEFEDFDDEEDWG